MGISYASLIKSVEDKSVTIEFLIYVALENDISDSMEILEI